MQHKLKQFVKKSHLTSSNRIPLLKSWKYFLNSFRNKPFLDQRKDICLSAGLLRWQQIAWSAQNTLICFRSGCFITGRNRGVLRRYGISRVIIKTTVKSCRLFGVRKSSF